MNAGLNECFRSSNCVPKTWVRNTSLLSNEMLEHIRVTLQESLGDRAKALHNYDPLSGSFEQIIVLYQFCISAARITNPSGNSLKLYSAYCTVSGTNLKY
jgi:hypothetical protein